MKEPLVETAGALEPELRDLPGSELVERGLSDLQAGNLTPEGLLLAPATMRLRKLGVMVPESALDIQEPEIALYHALGQRLANRSEDPYNRYNSWRRELDSFVSALEHRRRWDRG